MFEKSKFWVLLFKIENILKSEIAILFSAKFYAYWHYGLCFSSKLYILQRFSLQRFAALWPKIAEYDATKTPFSQKFIDWFFWNFGGGRQIDDGMIWYWHLRVDIDILSTILVQLTLFSVILLFWYTSSFLVKLKNRNTFIANACVRRGCYFANFAKSFRTGRSESTKQEISRNISRNNVESLERVPGVFSKMAASINDAVLLKYRVFERNKCYYGSCVLLMSV